MNDLDCMDEWDGSTVAHLNFKVALTVYLSYLRHCQGPGQDKV